MPEHPLAVGVTFIVAIIGLELVFVGVNEDVSRSESC
jgi:hypothetical protein